MIELSMLRAKLQHVFFIHNKVEEFEVQIENAQTKLWSKANTLFIEINGLQEIEGLKTILFNLLDMTFLYLGSYPSILSIIVDDKELDLSDLVSKYNTQPYFKRKDCAICSISEKTINEEIYRNSLKINQMPLYSMQYIFSDNYKNIIVTHRLILLLHVIDGVVPGDVICSIKSEIMSVYNLKDIKIGDYAAKVYYLCKNYFFNLDNRFNCEILSLLEVTKYEFIQIVSDTRNWYSHFLDENKKKQRLKDGEQQFIYLDIIFYSIRLFLTSQIGINIKDDWIREYFYSIHDWISVRRGVNKPYKSVVYKNSQAIEEMKKLIK